MITIASICRNEEAMIEAWLKILEEQPIIDKILILDTGSTDNTLSKINGKKIKAYKKPWEADFSKPRNFLINEAKTINNEFIWMLDIDEIPSKNLFNYLNKELENLKKFDVLMFPYIEFWDFDKPCFRHLPKKTALFNNFIYYEPFKPNICLIKNKLNFKYENSLHETLSFDNLNISNYFASKSNSYITPINDIYNENFVSHFSFPKYKKTAKMNSTSLEYELGLKRLNYRKIKPAITNNKEYTKEWASEERSYKEIEQLGKDQIEQFLNIEGYAFPDLNFEKIKEINYYNIIK